MAQQRQLLLFPPDMAKPTLMIASHERSGTHFLINSMARAHGYAAADHRLDLDPHGLQANYYAPENMAAIFDRFSHVHCRSQLKTHHHAEFFRPVLDRVLATVRILYIHRDPIEVMESYHAMIHTPPWIEGPRCADAGGFARAAPRGAQLRYQIDQQPSLTHRWAAHLSGWFDLADQAPDRIFTVGYESLRDDYATTITKLGSLLDIGPPQDTTAPNAVDHVFVPRKRDEHRTPMDEADRTWVRRMAATVIDRRKSHL